MTTIPLPEPGAPSIEDHLAISRRFLDHARVELDKGDRLQAAEKVWGAAAHALKAIAIQRGWRHRSHDSVMSVGSQLARECGREDLAEHLISANAMHINFYENGVPAILIKAAINNVERYIDKLDSVRSLPPSVLYLKCVGKSGPRWPGFGQRSWSRQRAWGLRW